MKNIEDKAHQIASMAQRAILYEVSATPKPGLVDRNDPGAHEDMDFYTFMDSSVSLYKGFFDCAMEGLLHNGDSLAALLDRLRKPGLKSEERMFGSTKGINTHKGVVFSIGICCAAMGILMREREDDAFRIEEICKVVSEITASLVEKDFKHVHKKSPTDRTYGERLYIEYGLKGIRGEVAEGFSTVRREAVVYLRKWNKERHLEKNQLMLELLLRIMQSCDDTNLMTRGGIDGLVYAKREARQFIERGGMLQEDAIEQLSAMNIRFCDRRLSPGGAADLLSVAVFLAMAEGIL